MENKTFVIFIFIFLILIIFSVTVLLALNSTEIGSSPKNSLTVCNTLQYNGKNALNLVFFSSEKDAEKYSNFLSQVFPFNEDKSKLNFFYISDYKPKCELYKSIAILCYSKELLQKASSCPNDYIIVLDKYAQNIRSSSYMNVMSLNTEHPLTVFLHEFGHAFANLAEEYVPAKIPRGAKNCVSACKNFQGEKDGCFEGCSREDYIRSVDNGIMRTLSSSTYGIFNENLLKERLTESLSAITSYAIEEAQNCENEKYYMIEAFYTPEKDIQLIEKSVQTGCVGSNGYGFFNYSLLDSQRKIISDSTFNPEVIFTDAPVENQIQGEVIDYTGNFILKLPAIDNARELQISHDGKITQFDLTDIGVRPCKV
mgnify:CR=1 FL=1